ncbi:MAG: hypothetical protein ACJA0Q_000182 [Saprospiraceae bacterium]|jgi:hypothetical protein
MQKLSVILLFLLLSQFAFSQADSAAVTKQNQIVQIAGVTVSGDSLLPVPFANVLIKGNYSGTLCDFSGFFSIVARAGDTLVFSSFGYKRNQYVIPDSLKSKQYSLIQIMDRDTVFLPVTDIKVWPTYEQFKKAFLTTVVPGSDLARAESNLDGEVMAKKVANLHLGASGNQKLMLAQRRSRLYSAGQLPPNNLLNPLAWMKFIKAWKEGKLGNSN